MMNHSCILVLLKTVKKEAKYTLVAEQGEAECPYCALLHAEGVGDHSNFQFFPTHTQDHGDA